MAGTVAASPLDHNSQYSILDARFSMLDQSTIASAMKPGREDLRDKSASEMVALGLFGR
jgi:hypothetical protein